ncbi:MAG: hypothetical protein MK105_17765 [Crocinitomicaceae bacterium]|nr:hypothetical protein [Crocinitomicaceae bacterium]
MKFLYLFLISLLISCNNLDTTKDKKITSINETEEFQLIPVNYDFKNLNIRLNTLLDDSLTNIEWRWDYMNSPNSMPDSNGQDNFMNINQESFKFNNEETLPSIGIKTLKKRIKEFSVTTIFSLQDTSKTEIERVLNELSKYDLLKTDSIKMQLVHENSFVITYDDYIEELKFELADINDGYSRLKYSIKTK